MTRTQKTLAWAAGLAAGVAAFVGGIAYGQRPKPAPKSYTVTTADSGKTVNLRVGDTLGVQLPGGDTSTTPATTPWLLPTTSNVLGMPTINVVPTAAGNATVYGFTARQAGSQSVAINAVDAGGNVTATFLLTAVVS
jgi:hypothetical protein